MAVVVVDRHVGRGAVGVPPHVAELGVRSEVADGKLADGGQGPAVAFQGTAVADLAEADIAAFDGQPGQQVAAEVDLERGAVVVEIVALLEEVLLVDPEVADPAADIKPRLEGWLALRQPKAVVGAAALSQRDAGGSRQQHGRKSEGKLTLFHGNPFPAIRRTAAGCPYPPVRADTVPMSAAVQGHCGDVFQAPQVWLVSNKQTEGSREQVSKAPPPGEGRRLGGISSGRQSLRWDRPRRVRR